MPVGLESQAEVDFDTVLSGLLDNMHVLREKCSCPFYRDTLAGRTDRL